jgi:predicted RNA-binding protein with PIN domain
MAIVRILVDGYSLLHSWPELAAGYAPYSAQAREALIERLTVYQQVTTTPITVFFDGSGAPAGLGRKASDTGIEVLYSRAGQTADQMIERAAHRFAPYGEVLAVTDDVAERETVISLGGLASSCLNFVTTVENTLSELAEDIHYYNLQERNRFRRSK